jgi:succinylglutamate desuccinylase
MNLLRDTLDNMPPRVVSGRGPTLAWRWCEAGIVEFVPDAGASASVVLSAGVHGDETAPIEVLDRLAADLVSGAQPLAVRLLIVFANPAAMRAQRRYLDHDMNRLFGVADLETAGSEGRRARVVERAVAQFFDGGNGLPRVHYDLHTAIRGSLYERFALLPWQQTPYSRQLIEWLDAAGIEAVLLNRAPSNTFTYHTRAAHGAASCTLELGKVRPFGDNDLSRFTRVDAALRGLVAGQPPVHHSGPSMRLYRVVDELKKTTDAFELLCPDDVANFTPFALGTVVARDQGYEYAVTHPEERIVFPNRNVKPGLRAGLMVVEQPLAELRVG